MTKIDNANEHRKTLISGVDVVGRLVGAMALTKFAVRALDAPVSSWLSNILSAYQTLFHPLVEYSIGLLPRVFGFELIPAAKDATVVYAMFGAIVYRSGYKYFRPSKRAEESELSTRLHVAFFGLIWPIFVSYLTLKIRKDQKAAIEMLATSPSELKTEIEWHRRINKMILRLLVRELSFVCGIAGAAIVLNAAGEL